MLLINCWCLIQSVLISPNSMCNNYLLLQVFLTTLIENVFIYLSNIYASWYKIIPNQAYGGRGPGCNRGQGQYLDNIILAILIIWKLVKDVYFFANNNINTNYINCLYFFFSFKNKSYILKGVLKCCPIITPLFLGHWK